MAFLSLVRAVLKGCGHPVNTFRWIKKKIRQKLFWNGAYAKLREPKKIGAIKHDVSTLERISSSLALNGFEIAEYKIDADSYQRYMEKAKYDRFPYYYLGGLAGNLVEKSLEHYLAAELLHLQNDDIYIDIANAESPTPEIYRELYGCKVYRQDLSFRKGINGNIIGGDASELPVQKGFATKMALHCSFEHFEGDSDIRFIKEASRVLKPGGRLCILPLYLNTEYAIQTDPAALPKNGINFDKDAVLYCFKGWDNRHGRYYDAPHLISRIRNNLIDLKLTICRVTNPKEISKSCYVNFIAVFDKPVN